MYNVFRLKNGDVIAVDESSGASTYVITNTTVEDTGYYGCRANNDYGASYSAIATVLVQGNSDTLL